MRIRVGTWICLPHDTPSRGDRFAGKNRGKSILCVFIKMEEFRPRSKSGDLEVRKKRSVLNSLVGVGVLLSQVVTCLTSQAGR